MHNIRLRNIINAALSLAMLDGGFIIAIQIIDFLLNYFGASLFGSEASFEGIHKGQFLCSLISILNLSVIITRTTGLTRGVKFNLAVCYQHAIRCWPFLIILYLIGSLLLLGISIPLIKLLTSFGGLSIVQYSKIMMLLVFGLIPYGLLACIFVVDQDQNPIRAIISTFNLIKNKLNATLLLSLSMLYSVPLYLSSVFATTAFATYLGLFATIWILFCHLVTLVIYISTSERINSTAKETTKSAKVIIV